VKVSFRIGKEIVLNDNQNHPLMLAVEITSVNNTVLTSQISMENQELREGAELSTVWYKVIIVDQIGERIRDENTRGRRIDRSLYLNDFLEDIYLNDISLSYKDIPKKDIILYTNEASFRKHDLGGERKRLELFEPIGDLGQAGSTPLIIAVPSEQVPSDLLTWVELDPGLPTLEKKTLAFVNRADAVSEVMKIHRDNFVPPGGTEGFAPAIPLIDNLWGMGKTFFAENYISEIQKRFTSQGTNSHFTESLSKARTIVLKMNEGVLKKAMQKSECDCHLEILTSFVRKINIMKDQGMIKGSTRRIEQCSNTRYPSLEAISTFISETNRPLFLVIDEIGRAFTSTTARSSPQKKEFEKALFLEFCRKIVLSWMQSSDFFILLTGRADFLDFIQNPHHMNPARNQSSAILRRVGLDMTRRKDIKEILKKTYRDSNGESKRLDEYYGINAKAKGISAEERENIKSKRKLFIDCLLARTNGHPRLMLRMLGQSTSYEQIIASTDSPHHELFGYDSSDSN